MARCPNCARTVHFWHNYSGYCSKQCRTDSITSCPSCGKVGLYKHERLGCCSEDCRWRRNIASGLTFGEPQNISEP